MTSARGETTGGTGFETWTLLVSSGGVIVGEAFPPTHRVWMRGPTMDAEEVRVVPLAVAEELAEALRLVMAEPQYNVHYYAAEKLLAEFGEARPSSVEDPEAKP